MVDGRFFNSYTDFEDGEIITYPHVCVEKGDGKYAVDSELFFLVFLRGLSV